MKIELSKKTASLIAVYAIAIVVYLFAFLIIPFPKSAASWISFVFTLVALAASCFITMYAFKEDEPLDSKVYGFPIFKVGAVYAIAQFVFGLLICILASFMQMPVWIPLLVSVVFLAAAAVGVIAADNIKDIVIEQKEAVEVQTKVMKTFTVDLSYVSSLTKDPILSKAVEKLAEEFRFSDPVSNEATEKIELQLNEEVDKLASLLKDNPEEAFKQIEFIKSVLDKRNRIAKESK